MKRSTLQVPFFFFLASALALAESPEPPAGCGVQKRSAFRDQSGQLNFLPDGIEFQPEGGGAPLRWSFPDIQQLKLSPGRLQLRTYEDRPWLLGSDRSYSFSFSQSCLGEEGIRFLREKISGVLVDGLSQREPEEKRYEAAVKLRRTWRGEQGRLEIGDREIAFRTQSEGQSRVWTYDQILSFALPSRRELELTTDEMKFGGPTRTFRFQLKTPLPDSIYDYLWVRVHGRARKANLVEGGQP